MGRRIVAVVLGLSVLCSFLSHVLCDEIDETDVLVLDKDNINEEMKKATHMLVEFYAPWCGHCKQLAPHWARAATAIKNAVPVVVVAKVDVEKNPELGERFGVEGFPALKWLTGYPSIFAQGEFADYDGGRTDSEIVAWVKKKFLPPCKQLNNTEDFASFKGSEEVVIMAFLDQSAVTTPCTSPFCDVWKTYEGAARKANDLTFAYTVNKDVHENATFKTGDVVMYKRHTKLGPIEELLFKKVDGTIQDLVSWIQIERLPIVTEFSQAYSDLIFKAPVDAQALLIARKHEDHAKTAHEALHSVAKDFRGKFIAVFVDAEAHPKVMEHFGVTIEETPCMYLVLKPTKKEGKMVKYKGPSSEELKDSEKVETSIRSSLMELIKGQLQPHRKSQEAPGNPKDEHGVVTVVANTFDDLVAQTSKDILVKFYAPWCGHCKELAPIYDKLANEMKGIDNLVIAKMDVTANDPPDAIDVQGFPELKFWKAGRSEAWSHMSFDGDRTMKGFRKFLKKNAGVAFELPKQQKKKRSAEL